MVRMARETAPGGMTALSERSPTWAIASATRRWAMSSVSWDSASSHPQADDHLERIYLGPHGHADGDRFLHHRGMELVQDRAVCHVLCYPQWSAYDAGHTHNGISHTRVSPLNIEAPPHVPEGCHRPMTTVPDVCSPSATGLRLRSGALSGWRAAGGLLSSPTADG